jgi:hypothetical protein
MRKITLIAAAVMSMFIAAGCKKSGGAAGEAASKMEGFAKSMCECADKKDKACGDKVQEDMKKWTDEMSKSAGKDSNEKPDAEIAKRIGDATTKFGDCMGKVMAAGMDKPADPPKADDKKPDDKTAEPAKADDKKPDDKAAAEPAKTDDKKPDDKKSGGW